MTRPYLRRVLSFWVASVCDVRCNSGISSIRSVKRSQKESGHVSDSGRVSRRIRA